MGFFSNWFRPSPDSMSELGALILESLENKPEDWKACYTNCLRHKPSDKVFYAGYGNFEALLKEDAVYLNDADVYFLNRKAKELLLKAKIENAYEEMEVLATKTESFKEQLKAPSK